MSEYYFLNSRELFISMACIFCWTISPVCDKQAQAVHSFSFCKSHMKGELILLCLLLLHLEIPEIKIILLYYQNFDLLSIQYPLPLHKCYTSINHLKINFQGQWADVLNTITLTSVSSLCVGGVEVRIAHIHLYQSLFCLFTWGKHEHKQWQSTAALTPRYSKESECNF